MNEHEVEPISIEMGEEDDEQHDTEALDARILRMIHENRDRTIRPARVAAETGLSLSDASAELCGLMAAVGSTASFRFEKLQGQNAMVFTFPPDFQQRARHYRRTQARKRAWKNMMRGVVAVIKLITAFGLILSLFILSVAAVAGLIAAMVAMSTQGGSAHHRSALLRQLQSLFFTLRELLWCYALFGPQVEGQDPVLRESAYDLWLVLSICCGNPGSLFFWMRANQLSRRRGGRRFQSWRAGRMASEIEGVSLIRSGGWGEELSRPTADVSRGLLSVAVEFLFGPPPVPEELEHWRLRAAFLIEKSTKSAGNGVSLLEVAPFADIPPNSLDDRDAVVEQGLRIVSHFGGAPHKDNKDEDPIQARFVFPELMAESSSMQNYEQEAEVDDGTWISILFSIGKGRRMKRATLPTYLQERQLKLTELTSQQFWRCVCLGVINCVGVVMFAMSTSSGGVLQIPKGSSLEYLVRRGLLPVLEFYAALFFALPVARLGILTIRNKWRRTRNESRRAIASNLAAA